MGEFIVSDTFIGIISIVIIIVMIVLRRRIVFGVFIGLAFGLLFGFIGLLIDIAFENTGNTSNGMMAGGIGGFIFGFLAGLTAKTGEIDDFFEQIKEEKNKNQPLVIPINPTLNRLNRITKQRLFDAHPARKRCVYGFLYKAIRASARHVRIHSI